CVRARPRRPAATTPATPGRGRSRRCAAPRSTAAALEQLLKLHGCAHVALDLELPRHVRRRRVLVTGPDLLERLRRGRDRDVRVTAALLHRQAAGAAADEPLPLALDVEQVRVVDALELRLVDARLEPVEELT